MIKEGTEKDRNTWEGCLRLSHSLFACLIPRYSLG